MRGKRPAVASGMVGVDDRLGVVAAVGVEERVGVVAVRVGVEARVGRA